MIIYIMGRQTMAHRLARKASLSDLSLKFA